MNEAMRRKMGRNTNSRLPHAPDAAGAGATAAAALAALAALSPGAAGALGAAAAGAGLAPPPPPPPPPLPLFPLPLALGGIRGAMRSSSSDMLLACVWVRGVEGEECVSGRATEEKNKALADGWDQASEEVPISIRETPSVQTSGVDRSNTVAIACFLSKEGASGAVAVEKSCVVVSEQ